MTAWQQMGKFSKKFQFSDKEAGFASRYSLILLTFSHFQKSEKMKRRKDETESNLDTTLAAFIDIFPMRTH